MSFFDWSDPIEMLSLLLEYVEDEFSLIHKDTTRRQFLSQLIGDLSDLQDRFSILSDDEKIGVLRELIESVDSEFNSDPVVEHMIACAEEIDRIKVNSDGSR